MLKKEKKCKLSFKPKLFSQNGILTVEIGRLKRQAKMAIEYYEEKKELQLTYPVLLDELDKEHNLWWYQDNCYVDDEGLTADQVKALINKRQDMRKREIERAVAIDAQGPREEEGPTRGRISAEVRHFVFKRDAGQCVECAAKIELQFDHIIPVALGGSSEPENLQLLCGPCNRRKGASLS